MSTRITCTAAVKAAYDQTASLTGVWTTAYAAVASDLDNGISQRDISAALAKVGVKAGKDLVGDMALAHSLTAYGDGFLVALETARTKGGVKPNSLMLPHSLITAARVARGIAYVRAVIATLDGMTGEQLEKALVKACRELLAAKREAKPKDGDEAPKGQEADEADEADEAPVPTGPKPATLDEILAAAGALIDGAVKRLRDGEMPTAAKRDAFMGKAAELAALLAATDDEAAAV